MAAFAGLAAAYPRPFHEIDGGGGDSDPHRSHSYHFQYAVHDPLTGDVKDQNEVSDGHGNVKGTYSLIEADGAKRVVEYTADDAHGFRALVKRIEPAAGAGHGRQVPSYPAPVSDAHDIQYAAALLAH